MVSTPQSLGSDRVLPSDQKWVRERRESVTQKLRNLLGAGGTGADPALVLALKLIARAQESSPVDCWYEAVLAAEDAFEAKGAMASLAAEERMAMFNDVSLIYGRLDRVPREGLNVVACLRRALQLRRQAGALMPVAGDDADRLVESAVKTAFLLERIYLITQDGEDLQAAMDELLVLLPRLQGEALDTARAHASVLSLRGAKEARFVLDVPFEALPLEPISLNSIPPRRFRFVDARSLAEGQRLRVMEMDALPKQRYVAISYVWRALPPPEGTIIGETMSIQGANNADPIALETLRDACRAALSVGCVLIWLDGLCIKQSDEDDKAWQIERMYSIYENCRDCVILPAGMSRLARLDEPTSWIHRAWTLQEALAPKRCSVLFSWGRGTCVLQSNTPAWVSVVNPGRAAIADLQELLNISIRGLYSLRDEEGNMSGETFPLRLIVSESSTVHLHALLGALELRGQDGATAAIWRAAVMRTAYRPVDMVLSIMGILGVELDPSRFGPNDRTAAMVELMRALLAKEGGRANWLALIPRAAPSLDLTTLPVIPRPSPSGEGYLITEGGNEVEIGSFVSGLLWWLRGAPTGTIDEEGYLAISAAVIALAPTKAPRRAQKWRGPKRPKRPEIIKDYRGRWWTILGKRRSGTGPYAVQIGVKENYVSGGLGTWIDPWDTILMLIEGTGNDRFHVLGYAEVLGVVKELPGWEKMDLRVQ